VAIMSYHGQMNFGLLGDYDALPDIDMIGESIRSELGVLLTRAAAVSASAAHSNGHGNGGVATPDEGARDPATL
jgi:hypothetical protein